MNLAHQESIHPTGAPICEASLSSRLQRSPNGLFIIEGSGGIGLKALATDAAAADWLKAGLQTQGGLVIADSYFIEFEELNARRIPNKTGSFDESSIYSLAIPESLKDLNRKILEMYPDTPLAFRSSASNEVGGCGIFETAFFLPRGDQEDLKRMAECELAVYCSCYSRKACAYKLKHPDMPQLMAIMVTPMVGDWHETTGDVLMGCHGQGYAPLLSGPAYS